MISIACTSTWKDRGFATGSDPKRWLAEQDRAAGWQAIFADLPALQFPPVVPGSQRTDDLGGKFDGGSPCKMRMAMRADSTPSSSA